MWFPQFTGAHVSSWLRRDTQLRVILIMSRSFGLCGVNPQHKLVNTAHHTAGQFYQPNPRRWTASCVSTPTAHIHRPGSTKGVFVLHFLSTAHRQECLRGKQQWLAGAPRLLLASSPSRAGTQPGASYHAKWVIRVQKDDWQHKRRNQEWLSTYSSARSQSMSKISDRHVTTSN